MDILYVYPCICPKKSPFWQNKYTKDGCEGKKPSHRRKTVFCVFVFLCIGAKKSQPYQQFFGIGVLPVSDLTGWLVFRWVLLVWRELLFSAKGGLAVLKRGPLPPFSHEKGASAPFLREKGVPAKKRYQNVPTEISFGIGMVNTKKYRPILTGKYQFDISLSCFLIIRSN